MVINVYWKKKKKVLANFLEENFARSAKSHVFKTGVKWIWKILRGLIAIYRDDSFRRWLNLNFISTKIKKTGVSIRLCGILKLVNVIGLFSHLAYWLLTLTFLTCVIGLDEPRHAKKGAECIFQLCPHKWACSAIHLMRLSGSPSGAFSEPLYGVCEQ